MNIEQLQKRLTDSIQNIPGSNVPTANFSPVWINNITRLNAQNLNERMYKSIDTFVQGYGDAIFRGSNSQLSELLKLLPGYKVDHTSTSEIHNPELSVVDGKEKLDSTNKAPGNYQAVFGVGNETVSTVDGQFVAGRYNKISNNFIFAIGNGKSENNRSNAFEVSNDGKIKVSNIEVTNGISTPYVKITGTITDDTYATNKKYVDTKVDEESERAKAAEDEIRTLAASAFHFKGSKDSYEELPTTGNTQGDVWQVGDKEYAWNGTTWVELGFNIDLSGKQDKFASVSHPDPDGNYTWLDVTTPNLDMYNSNHNSVISMSDNGLDLQSIQNHVQLKVGKKNIKISKEDSFKPSPLLGVSTPVTTADTALDITEADLPYQAVNKQYVDNNFQAKLVSGTNIKTINNQSLLGSGNIDISGGGGTIIVDAELSEDSTNPVQNKIITSALGSKQDTITDTTDLSVGNIMLKEGMTINNQVGLSTDTGALVLQGPYAAPVAKIKGVADGTDDNDAVNKKQLDTKQDLITSGTTLGVASIRAIATSTTFINVNSSYIGFFKDDTPPLLYISPEKYTSSTPTMLNLVSYAQSTTVGNTDVVINGVATPTADNHAVNKKYVDNSVNTKLSATTDKYSISWDDTNEGLKITFKE